MVFRKHLRLREFDYSSSYYYFVTICTDYRKKVFVPRVPEKYEGEYMAIANRHYNSQRDNSRNDVVRISNPPESEQQEIAYTTMVEKVLLDIPQFYTNIVIDFYVFMPDHIHVILGFEGMVTLRQPVLQPIDNRHYVNSRNYTLGDIVKSFKKVSTKKLRNIGFQGRLFQPNYYEHVIRDERSLDKIRRYIMNNPLVQYTEIPWNLIDPNLV